jgi:uncharacterized membrane protein YkvA (DUF1232 family)
MDNTQKAQPFVRLLQERVDTWLASDEARQFQCAELYRYLPGLYVFLMRLATEARVPPRERTGVLAALKYIIAPYDLIPEGVVGTSGFRDDLVLAAMTVEHVSEQVPTAVLDLHWQQPGDPVEVARTILDAGQAMVGASLCERLKDWLPH